MALSLSRQQAMTFLDGFVFAIATDTNGSPPQVRVADQRAKILGFQSALIGHDQLF